MKKLLALALLALPLHTEGADDEIRQPNDLVAFGHDILVGGSDADWWKLSGHSGTFTLYVTTGVGALCGCPKGSPFAPYVEVYDNKSNLLGAFQGVSGALQVSVSGAPLVPLRIRIEGSPWGPERWSEYSVLVL